MILDLPYDLLMMIQGADPSDEKKLDEIDAKVAAYALGYQLVEHSPGCFAVSDGEWTSTPAEFTRSRDALKAIRPEGWNFKIWSGGACEWSKFPFSPQNVSEKTEELAELHAIVRAIAFDRAKA